MIKAGAYIRIILFGIISSLSLIVSASPKSSELDYSIINLENEVSEVTGEFDYYWNIKITASHQLDTLPDDVPRGKIAIPGFWSLQDDEFLANNPYGLLSIHLNVLLPDSTNQYMLKLNSVVSAYEIWANGNLISNTGVVGNTKDQSTPDFQTQLVELPKNNNVELFIVISNFHHRKGGGSWEPILIGTKEQITSSWKQSFSFELIVSSIIFFICIYHLLMFVFYKKEKTYFYMALFVAGSFVFTAVQGEMVIEELFPSFPYGLNQRLRYIGLFINLGGISMYYYHFFHNAPKKFLSSYFYFALVCCLLVIFLPVNIGGYLSTPFQIVSVVLGIYGVQIVYKGLSKFDFEAVLIVSGFVILYTTLIHGLLVTSRVINDDFQHATGYLLFILTQAILLAMRHQRVQVKAQNLTIELSETNLGLEKRIEERTSEIRLQQEQLQELDKVKSRFFANISHEFRTPLTIISGIFQRLEESTKGSDSKELTSTGLKHSDLLKRLIDQLLDVSKLQSGSIKRNLVKSKIHPLLKSYVTNFQSLAQEKGVEFEFESRVDVDLERIIDKDSLEKIIYNLISNAIKFTDPGGRVLFELAEAEDQLKFKVIDTGLGISKDQLPYIFDRFYQADNSLQKEYQGTGIGLSLVKELVDLNYGNISVTSEENRGTTFIVEIQYGARTTDQPIELDVFPVKSNSELKLINKDDSGERPHVLIVEDQFDLSTLMANSLQDDYKVSIASNGVDGFSKATEDIPDLVISDIMMPKMDGFELCEKLKSDARTSHIPIVLLTAKSNKEDKLAGLRLGADDYLPKPFDLAELRIRISNLIAIRENLKEKFQDQINLSNVGITPPNKSEKTFMEKLDYLLSSKYQDENFNSDFIADEMKISKRQLNRKLNAIMGTSLSKLIQNYRLSVAKQLLQDPILQIGEVGFKVGFSSRAYFNKCFKEKYGETPKEFQEKSISDSDLN